MWPAIKVIEKTRELCAEFTLRGIRHRRRDVDDSAIATSAASEQHQQLWATSSSSHLMSDFDSWELIDRPNAFTSMHRSTITHAVLGSEAVGIQSLPPELLIEIFIRLDAHALCALAQVSSNARSYADDDGLWMRSSVGHSKEVERVRFLHAAQLRAERLEAEARWKRARWRRRRRRAIGVLQAICGVALVLLPLFAILHRQETKQAHDDRRGLIQVSSTTAATVDGAGSASQRALRRGDIGDIVWGAAAHHRSGRCVGGSSTRPIGGQ